MHLFWKITVRNAGEAAVVVEDLKLPLQMNILYVADAKVNYTEQPVCHAYISGNTSVLQWQDFKSRPVFWEILAT